MSVGGLLPYAERYSCGISLDKHDILPQTVYESRYQGQVTGCVTSLTLEDEERPDLDLPRVVYDYVDVFFSS